MPISMKDTVLRYWEKFWKGIIVGIVIITPVSGGTMLLVLGLYEDLMKDLSALKLARWASFGLGTVPGILLSGQIFATLFQNYTVIILAFLLGCVLASIRSVLGENYRPNVRRILIAGIGLFIGLMVADVREFGVISSVPPGFVTLLLGGAMSSATMILPGIPGGSVLIMMGIYDDMIMALAAFDWKILLMFGAGALIGIIGLSSILDRLYSRYRIALSWLFAGLIIGSGTMLIPVSLDSPLTFIMFFLLGFLLVWNW